MRGFVSQLVVLACLALVLSGASPRFVSAERLDTGGAFALSARAVRAPAFERDFPDPSVISAGGRYYAFATQTSWEPRGHVIPILVSGDLAHWSYAADVFATPPAWGRGDWWAPAVVARGHTYF